MRKKRWLALALALTLCLALPGCGKKAPADSDPTPTAESGQPSPSPTPAAGDSGTLTVCLGGEPGSIDPTALASADEMALVAHMFEGLMKWSGGGKKAADGVTWAQVVPGMAESYQKADGPEGSVIYTFRLRQAKWSDGKAVTAHDFVYAWQRLVDPANGADYADVLDWVNNAHAVAGGWAQLSDLGVRAVDDYTFEVTLEWDAPGFLELCAMPITAPLRQDKIEEGGSQWTYGPDTYISNGPYKILNWDYGYLSMEKNPEYYEKVKGPNTIVFAFPSDAATALASYQAGEIDFLLEPAAGQLEPDRVAYLGSYYLMFQTQQAPFDDPLVRQAFSLAIDRTALVEEQAPGQTPAGGLVPGGTAGADGEYRSRAKESLDPSKKGYAANQERAKALLSQAGYPGGKGFPDVTYLCPDAPAHQAIGQALCEMWKEALGVSVTVESLQWGDFLARCHRGEFFMARGRWVADYNDPFAFLELWFSEMQGNDARYAQEQYDQLLERSARAGNAGERMDLLAQAEDLLIGRDHALAPLYYETRSYLKKDAVKDVRYSPLGYFIFTESTKK